MKKQRVLIYGAGGRTGQAIARHAKGRGLDIVVAGRSAGTIAGLAHSLGCEARIASVDDRAALATMLRDVGVVINAAGPFVDTASLIAAACVEAPCHYLDVNGELEAYQEVIDWGDAADDAGVLLVPGAGYCVVASTILLAGLLQNPGAEPTMREPTRARIAFYGGPASSVGSIRSLYASLYPGVKIAQDGAMVSVPIGSLERAFDFGPDKGRLDCTAISVADTRAVLADAPKSLGQIETYVEGSLAMRSFFEGSGRSTPYSKVQPWKGIVDRAMSWWPATPDSGVDTRSTVCVEVDNPWLQTRQTFFDTPSTYEFTAVAACAIAQLILAGVTTKRGFRTPVSLFAGHPNLMAAFGSKKQADPARAWRRAARHTAA